MSTLSDYYSCKMTTKWDFATSSNTGKWTQPQELYRFNDVKLANSQDYFDDNEAELYDFDVIKRKNKVRGMGAALIFRFESSAGKDFQLLGWEMDITGVTG